MSADLTPEDPRLAEFGTVGFDRALPGMKITQLGDGHAKVTLVVVEDVRNVGGTLHGGAMATLVDVAGTLALMSADRESRPGVTTDLNVTCMAPVPGGTTVTAIGRSLRVGRTLGYVEVEIRTEAGKLAAQGRMTKFMGPLQAPHP